MVSYTLFNVGCLDKVSLKLCFGDKVPTTKVLWGDAISGGVFAFFWPTLPRPRRQSNQPIFSLKFFFETRLSYKSLEPLIGRIG